MARLVLPEAPVQQLFHRQACASGVDFKIPVECRIDFEIHRSQIDGVAKVQPVSCFIAVGWQAFATWSLRWWNVCHDYVLSAAWVRVVTLSMMD
jgi:hypothetical protein